MLHRSRSHFRLIRIAVQKPASSAVQAHVATEYVRDDHHPPFAYVGITSKVGSSIQVGKRLWVLQTEKRIKVLDHV